MSQPRRYHFNKMKILLHQIKNISKKMNHLNLALKIKELRNKKGFSQEMLAEESSLSLRTIQRIENDETVPRGDTLKRLAIALDTSPDEIIDWKIQEDQEYLRLMNLSALWFLIFPLLGIIIPLTMWIQKKDKLKNVNELGISILNFQITWTIIFSIIFVFLSIVLSGSIEWNFLSQLIVLSPLIILYLYNFILIISNTIKISKNKPFKFRPALPFIKK
jgi:transcriptional regulator with XRE-family HTH domain